ncbi:hypothetical protein [Parerythrobacter aestuarii]|uniref:hypothetical protein n=1 Tax=Parerythrobacter aestuarii TaxID=3020909 RepID=UPI0024DE48D7|nr:hypothetical protein [Parerythrobacter aestuarii]
MDRRTVIKGSAAASAAIGVPVAARASHPSGDTVLIFDSRIPESASFAAERRKEMRLVDIACADEQGWPMLRGALPEASEVEGLTGWSDWVSVRGELEARGWRFHRDNPIPAPLSGKAHLFRWSLKRRS